MSLVQLHGFTGWPIEIGPEFVHGAHSKLTELLDQYGLKATEKPWPDYWYFGKEQRLTDNSGVAPEVDEVSGSDADHKHHRTVIGSRRLVQ